MPFNEEPVRNGIDPNNFFTYKFPDRKLPHEPFSKTPVPKIKECYDKDDSASSDNSSPKTPDDDSTSSNEDNIQGSQSPQIIKWRRAITKDKPAIKQLQTLNGEVANVLYRKRNIDELIEKSSFPIVQIDSRGKLVSFTAYDPYPNIPAIPPFICDEWLSTTYRIQNADSGNVLFVHYMVWQPQQAHEFLRLLLEASFSEFVQLKHIIIVKPPRTDVPDLYTEYFIPVLPSTLETFNFDSIQTLLVCLRTSIIYPSPIRTALEEDFDRIFPVINRHAYPEAITNSPMTELDTFEFVYHKEKRALICEFGRNMSGLMILNLEIGVDSLNEIYELSPFNGLRKRDQENERHIEPSQMSVYKHAWWGMAEHPNALISSDYLLRQIDWSLTKKEKVMESSPISVESFETASTISDFSGLSIFESIDENQSGYSKRMSSIVTNQSKHDLHSKIGDIRVSVRSSITKMPYFHVPKYHGELNAFVIDFFAIDCSKINERIASFEFLKAAFKTIPDREYCLLIIPTHVVSFPLLELFVRVTPRILSNHTHELYLCHKNSIFSPSVMVRSTEKEDLNAIKNFLRKVTDKDEIYHDIIDSFIIKEEFKSYVFTIENKIAGVSLINLKKVCAGYFQRYFDLQTYTVIELHKNENQSAIKYLIINPKYRNRARFFVRDIMRLADLTCLYYVFNEPKKDWMNKLTILDEFVPVRPKQKAAIVEEPNCPSGIKENLYKTPFSLSLMNTRICSYAKFHINTVLVIVGASQTAFSFLESLIYGPSGLYVTYNNLIWVTPHEIEESKWEMKHKDLIFPVRDNCSTRYRSMACLGAYVNFVFGVMTEIDRHKKYIVVNNKVTLRYDYLILACGLQYLSPTPKSKEMPKYARDKNFRSSLARFLIRSEPKRITAPKHPVNMFIINTSSDAQTTLMFLEHLMRKMKYGDETDKKIVLYGHDLQVFLTLQVLLKMGIPGEVIVFVEPFPIEDQNFTLFNDSYVDQAVIQSVKNCKVHYYTEYFLYDWSLTSDDFITSLNFHSERKQIVIPCLVFLPFLEKLASDVTFNACVNAGLVYDGRLVINHNFRTNDRYIYGAGPFTKYARRYYASDKDHQFFSSKEVGEKLADILRSKIDPTYEDGNKYKEESDLVPQMKAPLLCYCQLPGGFNYLVVKKPGKTLDLETSYNISDYGEVLTTGNCQMEKGIGYFRIHLNSSGCVEDITCYTKKEFDYVNLSFLYGLHEKLLNNLLLRYDLSLISDFFEYFSQPWALALFHENFQILRSRNYMVFCKPLSKMSSKSFNERLISKLVRNRWRHLPEIVRLDIEKEYKNSKIEKKITKNIVRFIETYVEDLPVYAVPSLVNNLLRERSLF